MDTPARSADRCSVKHSSAAAKPHGGLHSSVRAASFKNKGEVECQLVLRSGNGENCIATRRRVASTAPPVLRQQRRLTNARPEFNVRDERVSMPADKKDFPVRFAGQCFPKRSPRPTEGAHRGRGSTP